MDATVSTRKASLSDEHRTYDTLVLCAAKRTSLRVSFGMIVDEGGWPLFSIDASVQSNSQGRTKVHHETLSFVQQLEPYEQCRYASLGQHSEREHWCLSLLSSVRLGAATLQIWLFNWILLRPRCDEAGSTVLFLSPK